MARNAGDGTYTTITELAQAERIDHSYVGRVLRLTLLAPDIVEAIVGGRQPGTMTLGLLVQTFPIGWDEQNASFEGPF